MLFVSLLLLIIVFIMVVEVSCDVMVDYLNLSRKPTRAKKTAVMLDRDGVIMIMNK